MWILYGLAIVLIVVIVRTVYFRSNPWLYVNYHKSIAAVEKLTDQTKLERMVFESKSSAARYKSLEKLQTKMFWAELLALQKKCEKLRLEELATQK